MKLRWGRNTTVAVATTPTTITSNDRMDQSTSASLQTLESASVNKNSTLIKSIKKLKSITEIKTIKPAVIEQSFIAIINNSTPGKVQNEYSKKVRMKQNQTFAAKTIQRKTQTRDAPRFSQRQMASQSFTKNITSTSNNGFSNSNKTLIDSQRTESPENRIDFNTLKKINNDPVVETYRCDICTKECKTMNGLTVHKLTHTGEETFFECHICKARFVWQKSLKVHQRIHTIDKTSYKCELCPKEFATGDGRQIHTGKIHRSKDRTKSKGSFECPFCEVRFSQSSHLMRHVGVHTGERPYKCDFCCKEFRQRYDLSVHIRIHTGEMPYECEFCHKRFRASNNLLKHKLRHCSGVSTCVERSLRCEFCKVVFTKHELEYHVRCHTGEKPYKCDICKRDFRRMGDLKVHRRRHTGEKPYRCEFCNKTFSRSGVLLVHRRIHTGETPYQCEFCDMKFTRLDTLSHHKTVVH